MAVDGQNPAPPKNPWNDGSLVNTNRPWFPMVSKWCRILSIHGTLALQMGSVLLKHISRMDCLRLHQRNATGFLWGARMRLPMVPPSLHMLLVTSICMDRVLVCLTCDSQGGLTQTDRAPNGGSKRRPGETFSAAKPQPGLAEPESARDGVDLKEGQNRLAPKERKKPTSKIKERVWRPVPLSFYPYRAIFGHEMPENLSLAVSEADGLVRAQAASESKPIRGLMIRLRGSPSRK